MLFNLDGYDLALGGHPGQAIYLDDGGIAAVG